MLRRNLLAMLLVVAFLVIFCGKVEAATCTKNVVVDYDNKSGLKTTEPRTVNEGQSVCDKDVEFDSGSMTYIGWPKLLTCQSDGFKETTSGVCFCIDDGAGNAYCETKSNKECKSANGTNTSATLTHMETGCMGFQEYGTCDGSTGQMKLSGKCADGEYCADYYYWFFGEVNYYTCQKASCTLNGVTANNGESKCIGTSKYKCSVKGNFDFVETCKGECINDPVSGPTCVGDENNTKSCSVIDGVTGTDIPTSMIDRSVCYKDKIYKCNTIPGFEFERDCGSEGLVCYTKTGEKYADCDTSENINKMNGVIATTTTQETVMTSSDFICTVDGGNGISTALGCVPVEMSKFVPWLLGWLFGVAGGIAFLLMAYGFILIATSSGDEKKVQGARETITSAVIGLIVCIFAVFILKLVAVNILNIPGMS